MADVIRCDECGIEREKDSGRLDVRLRTIDPQSGQCATEEELDFCDHGCLAAWAARMEKENDAAA